MGTAYGIVEWLTWAGIPTVDEGSAVGVLKAIAMGLHCIVMMNFKSFPSPTVVGFTDVSIIPLNQFKHAVERSREGELTELTQTLLDEWRADNSKRLEAVSIGDVFSLKQKERKSKDMVAVNMCDKNGLNVSDVLSVTAKSCQRGWRRIDDMLAVQHGK